MTQVLNLLTAEFQDLNDEGETLRVMTTQVLTQLSRLLRFNADLGVLNKSAAQAIKCIGEGQDPQKVLSRPNFDEVQQALAQDDGLDCQSSYEQQFKKTYQCFTAEVVQWRDIDRCVREAYENEYSEKDLKDLVAQLVQDMPGEITKDAAFLTPWVDVAKHLVTDPGLKPWTDSSSQAASSEAASSQAVSSQAASSQSGFADAALVPGVGMCSKSGLESLGHILCNDQRFGVNAAGLADLLHNMGAPSEDIAKSLLKHMGKNYLLGADASATSSFGADASASSAPSRTGGDLASHSSSSYEQAFQPKSRAMSDQYRAISKAPTAVAVSKAPTAVERFVESVREMVHTMPQDTHSKGPDRGQNMLTSHLARPREIERTEVAPYSPQSRADFRGVVVPRNIPDLANVAHPRDVPPQRLGSRPSTQLEASDSSSSAMRASAPVSIPETPQVVVQSDPSIHGAARGKAKAKSRGRFATALPPGPVSSSSASSGRARQQKVIPSGMTTLIVRNVPARITPDGLLEIWPPHGMYNFLHMPYSHRYRRTVGCVFINFVSHQAAVAFTQRWDGKFLMDGTNTKKLDIGIAEIQGFRDNLMHMRCSKKVMRMRNARHLPLIVLEDGTIGNFREIMASIVPPPNMVEVEDESDDEDASETQESRASSDAAAAATQHPQRNATARRN
jgi:hypothetical protein